MIKFPSAIDDDASIPYVNDNINEIGGEVINAVRDATIALETEVGIGGPGTTGSIAERLGVSIQADGYIKSSALTSLGLVTLPITNSQIANNAGIPESKLTLNYRTSDLFNYIQDLSRIISEDTGWISITGMKLEPHVTGFAFFHYLNHILVSGPSDYLKNKFNLLRDNTDSFAVIDDMNDELLAHQWADGSPFGLIQDVTTNNGSTYPSNYGHTASGIFLNTNRFTTIPQTMQDLQLFADFIDSSSIFLLGTRIQNLYSNGISKVSRSSSLSTDGYGQPIAEVVPTITYLLSTGVNSSPFDDIDKGDDIIELIPTGTLLSSNSYDAQFALVKTGDIIRVNYGSIEIPFIIKEKKYIQDGLNKKFFVRINGKNIAYSTIATARIDRSLVNPNKYGVLALGEANNTFSEIPSLIVGSPRGAEALGIGFNPDFLNTDHYLLYLAIYPTGNPKDGYTILPGIDVTGNAGVTPGKYTLESVVEATNNAFRRVGYNYRFISFAYAGNFGIKLADAYNNAGFSILSAMVNPADGTYDQTGTAATFNKNVVDVFATPLSFSQDALGFGPNAAALASPPFMTTYGSSTAAVNPTKLFVPLKRNNYYVNGSEKEQLASDVGQVIDGYGDTYWTATVTAKNPVPAPYPAGHVEVTYTIPLDLSTSNLKAGKTLVIQSLDDGGTLVDFGRFIIKTVVFTNACTPSASTEITVYDGVHATGISPSTILDVGSTVALYFDSTSVSFNKENSSDITLSSPPAFKRHFEVLITQDGLTFTHERARMNVSGSTITLNGSVSLYSNSELAKFNIVNVSSKIRGYQFGQVKKITFHMNNYDSATGIYSGYLGEFDGSTFLNYGNLIYGRKGEVTRFYDSTNVDYIDLVFDVNESISTFSSANIDIQIFPTLSLDDEVMLLGTCQLNDVTNKITYLRDARQFGNIGEKDLSTSALNMISLPEKLLHGNGVIRGFDIANESTAIPSSEIHIMGGQALVDGKLLKMNDAKLYIPALVETYSSLYYKINWALCVNNKGEYQFQPLLDYDEALGTVSTVNRVMQVFNPNNGQTYYIDANTFSDIINKRKDLTILYIVGSSVTLSPLPATISLDISDARRYVTDVDNNIPLTLTVGESQGSFKNSISIFNWIKFNNSFNGTAYLNGAADEIIDIPLTFNFDRIVTIDGQNNCSVKFNEAIKLGSNVTFKNMTMYFYNTLEVLSGASNITFENCILNIETLAGSPPTDNIIFDFNLSDNIKFKETSITVAYSDQGADGAVFRLTNCGKFRFDDSSVNVTFNPIAGTEVPGQVFIINSLTNNEFPNFGVKVTNSTFTGNFLQFMVNSASNVYLYNLSLTSTYRVKSDDGTDIYLADTTNGMPQAFTYDSTDFVNSGRGWYYSNIETQMSDITIDKVSFNYSPTTANSYRLGFINFELTAYNATLKNVSITNCRFNHLNMLSASDDLMSAISIINKTQPVSKLYPQPTISNIDISNNVCNRNQMILITSQTLSDYMYYAGIVASGVNIHDNICGTIGYWVSSDTKYVNTAPNVNAYTDKNSNLIISNNTCHYISNLDHKGKYFYPTKEVTGVTVNKCNYPTGYVNISKNKANWIHVGNTSTESSSLQIMNNSLCAYDQAFIALYGDGSGGLGIGYGYGYAIVAASNIHEYAATSADLDVPDSPCVISGNTVGKGYWVQTSFSFQTYQYPLGYILSQGSCQITQNTLKGIDSTLVLGLPVTIGILTTGINSIITHNRIYRNGEVLKAYIAFGTIDLPQWNGANSRGIITDNFFDSPWIDSGSFDENVINLTGAGATSASKWVVERNINQTVSISIPITSAQLYGSIGMASTTTPPAYTLNQFVTCAPGIDTLGVYKSLVLWIHEGDVVTPADKYYGWQESLDKYLPNGVRIMYLKMGIRPFNTVVEASSQIYLSLNRYSPSVNYTDLDSFLTPSTGMSPPYGVGVKDENILNDADPQGSTINGATLNSTTYTIPAAIDTTTIGSGGTDISHQFVTGMGTPFGVSLDIKFKRVSGSDLDLYFSPLLVKYRW